MLQPPRENKSAAVKAKDSAPGEGPCVLSLHDDKERRPSLLAGRLRGDVSHDRVAAVAQEQVATAHAAHPPVALTACLAAADAPCVFSL